MVTLDRGMGLVQATATNIIGMVGVGPFLTIPFMVSAMGGPHIIYAWAFGAVLALCDGLVYAELGAALPGSGGPYVYLREAYRPFGLLLGNPGLVLHRRYEMFVVQNAHPCKPRNWPWAPREPIISSSHFVSPC